MAKIDKIKENIGYLKLVFSILIAIDVSLIAWIYKNINIGLKLIIPFIIVVIVTFAIVIVNKRILYKIDLLEKLW